MSRLHVVFRRVLLDHRPDWSGPDEVGRVGVCGCGWWDPDVRHTQHLLDALADAGVSVTMPTEAAR